MKILTPLIALTAIVALMAGGCASSGYKKAGRTSTSLQKAAQDIDKSNAQLDVVLAGLSDLVSNPDADIRPQFKKCDSEMSKLESLAKKVSDDAAAMQSQGSAYFQQWDEELAKIQSEDIRSRSAERKSTVAAHFDRVRISYGQAKTAFEPLLSDLKDIRTALATDLTTEGLASVKSVVNKANQDAPPVRESLGKLAADFKELGVSLSADTASR